MHLPLQIRKTPNKSSYNLIDLLTYVNRESSTLKFLEKKILVLLILIFCPEYKPKFSSTTTTTTTTT
ncbi:hypothetical protein Scep_010376 [Stephania cephalantha]|uniref:Uncharacterized protein n=1 Tax=Stephania cephalantha TaxID=152367 RepID=A0AAP0PH05_9MAGN